MSVVGASSHKNQWWPREDIRCMYPDEIVSLVRQFRLPCFNACGLLRSRHGDLNREASNLVPHGSVWFQQSSFELDSNGHYVDRADRISPIIVPANCIPYNTRKTARFDNKTNRFERGELLRGWRNFFSQLIRQGYLRGSAHLSFLIGEDTLRMGKPEYKFLYQGEHEC